MLIENATGIFTGRPGAAMRTSGAIRIRDGVIVEIGALQAEPTERRLDCSGCVVYPGLISSSGDADAWRLQRTWVYVTGINSRTQKNVSVYDEGMNGWSASVAKISFRPLRTFEGSHLRKEGSHYRR